MERKRQLPPRPHFVNFVAAMLAVLIAVGVMSTITTVFASEGTPFGQMVAADRACATPARMSEAASCERDRVAAHSAHVATR